MALLTQIKGIEQLSRPDTFKAITIIKKIKTHPDYRRLFENFASLTVLQALNYILPLITFPYLVRVLGVEKFGLLAFATATIGYFQIITDYGLNLSATREIAIHRENKEKVQEIFSAVMTIKFGLMLLSLILLTILVFSFEKFRQDWEVYFLTFGMVVGNTLFPVWFFQGMERMKYITILNIIAKGLFTIAIFIYIREQSDYWKVPLINGLGFWFAGFMSLAMIFNSFNIKFKKIYLNEIKYQLKSGWHIFVSTIAISLYTISTTFILGLLTNNTIVGYFASADKIINAFKGLMGPVSQALYPFMTTKFHNDKNNSFLLINRLAKIISIFTFFVSLFILIFSQQISNLFLGNSFYKSIILVQIMSFLPMIISLSNLYAIQGLYSLNMQKLVSDFVVKVSLFHLVHVIIMVNYFEAIGAAVSVVITEIIITVFSVVKFNLIKKEMQK